MIGSSPNSLRILFAGSGEFGRPTLATLLDAGHHIARVYTQPDRPAGRGKKLTPTPIAQFAMDRGLELTPTANLNAEELPAADLLIVIAFGQKISEAVANHPRLGSVNLHASRLPQYRGAAPINWAILRGEAVTGNSIIRLAQRMDAGAVLGMSSVLIGEVETAGELHDRLAEDGAALMLRVVNQLAAGRAVETPQDETMATTAPKLSRETAQVDWSQFAEVIARRIRGLSPWPGCRVRLLGSDGGEIARLTLLRAKAAGDSDTASGAIDDHGHIGSGNGTAIEVLQLQPEGKRPMTLADFRNGRPWGAGLLVESLR